LQPAGDEALPGQIALFGDRWVRLSSARRAISEARFDDARRVLAETKKRFPTDAFVVRGAQRAGRCAKQLAQALAASPNERAARILSVANAIDTTEEEPWQAARRALLRLVARELCAAEGDGGRLEGQRPGWYFIAAGAVDEAVRSLRAIPNVDLDADDLFLLGDALTQRGEREAARRQYLMALVWDPFDGALATARDAEIRALPAVARWEIELEDEPTAWSAPVGIVTGVLPAPLGLSVGMPRDTARLTCTPAQADALARARAFVKALAELASLTQDNTSAVVELRRAMKQLSPIMFGAYMDRVVRRRQSR
jgi:tetratricopeptide (TPR) repeat protein